MRLSTILFVVFAFSPGVVHAGPIRETAPQNVTYCELAKNPLALSGKRIRIRAIYSYMFEFSRLKSPACCANSDFKIWVDFDAELENRSQKLLDKFPKGMGNVLAVFVGTVESGEVYGPFGERFRLNVDKIERVEKMAKPSRSQGAPTWIPNNCERSGGRQTDR